MAGTIILEQHLDHVSTQQDIEEYAEWLGMNLEEDRDYLWIAEEGLKSSLPAPWLACLTGEGGEVFFFNNVTGESTWEHPCDECYRQLFKRAKAKNEPRLIGTISATELDSGAVEISVTSMGGDELTKIEVTSPKETLQMLSRKIRKELNQKVRLVLPDGRLLARMDRKALISTLLNVSIDGEVPDGHRSHSKWQSNSSSTSTESASSGASAESASSSASAESAESSSGKPSTGVPPARSPLSRRKTIPSQTASPAPTAEAGENKLAAPAELPPLRRLDKACYNMGQGRGTPSSGRLASRTRSCPGAMEGNFSWMEDAGISV